MQKKIVLIDGHSMMNRAFYGVPPLTNSKGLHTNAIYGFLNIMLSTLDEIQPDYLAVAFDLKAPTFRHKMYTAYKGTRKGMPDELHEQIPVIKDVLAAMNIPVITLEGYEADDILGTIAGMCCAENIEVCIMSGDRDLLQLATDKVYIRMPHTKAGKTEIDHFYAKDVLEKYQVTPAGIIELKALMGDSSDNIPGVPKVGEKTATELVKLYGTIENLKEHREEISKKSIRETLLANFELAELSKQLATINTKAPLDFKIEDARLDNPFTKKAYELICNLEFKNIINRFSQDTIFEKREEINSFKLISEFRESENVIENALKSERLAAVLIGENKKLLALSLCVGKENIYVIQINEEISEEYLLKAYAQLAENSKAFHTFSIKEQLHYYDKTDIKYPEYSNVISDEEIMVYLINPVKNDYSVTDIANEMLGLGIKSQKQYFDKLKLEKAMHEMPEEFIQYAGYLSYVCFMAYEPIKEKLAELDMLKLYENIEMPLCFILYEMEREGVIVRKDELKEYGNNLSEKIASLEKDIYELSGEEFNINSPKQLGELLFGKMQIPGGKKTKTGYSTSAEVLEKLAPEYPIVSKILEYRGLSKLKSTYADGLAGFIDEDNKIHSTFKQTITATGRLSSADPNLQNIPIRTKLGRELRKVFVPAENRVFVDADYSQIELRLLACMSGDENLIGAYGQDQDIHKITASQVFKVPLGEVTPELRRNAKAVNFGVVYGISSFGLSQDLSISRKEAKDYIDNYFKTFPQVKLFLDGLVENAKKNGYVTTMFKRRRPVPELSAGNFMQRQFGERVAMNAPIQGTAADIMKLAMIAVYNRLKADVPGAKMLLQVHDEILVECDKSDVDKVKNIVKEEMMGVVTLPVSLEAEVLSGDNWYEAH